MHQSRGTRTESRGFVGRSLLGAIVPASSWARNPRLGGTANPSNDEDHSSFESAKPRSQAAERLRTLADELDAESDEDDDGSEISVPVGNKHVRLSPPETIGYEIGVREGSSVLRGSRETVSIKLDWKPE